MADYVPTVGDTHSYARTFDLEEVREFAELSRDEGYHHLVADEEGAVVVHGLLTASLPTKLGGDIDFVARDMRFEFPRPVYTSQRVTCELEVEDVEETGDRYRLSAAFECTTEDGAVVLAGDSSGVVFK